MSLKSFFFFFLCTPVPLISSPTPRIIYFNHFCHARLQCCNNFHSSFSQHSVSALWHDTPLFLSQLTRPSALMNLTTLQGKTLSNSTGSLLWLSPTLPHSLATLSCFFPNKCYKIATEWSLWQTPAPSGHYHPGFTISPSPKDVACLSGDQTDGRAVSKMTVRQSRWPPKGYQPHNQLCKERERWREKTLLCTHEDSIVIRVDQITTARLWCKYR